MRIHVVKRGETLSGIFGATGWQRIAQLNNLRNPNLIYPWQQLHYCPQLLVPFVNTLPHTPISDHHVNQGDSFMDISEATTLAAAIVALIQTFKQCIPDGYATITSLAVSLLLGVIAIAATGGFTGYGWGVILAAIVGVAQAVTRLSTKQ